MADMAIEQPKSETMAARIGRAFAHGPLNLFLIFVGLAWLVPTIGLFLTSLLSPGDFINNGWWKVFSHPSLATSPPGESPGGAGGSPAPPWFGRQAGL